MPGISVRLDGDHEAFGRDVTGGRRVVHSVEDWCLDVLEGGMSSGRTSLMLAIPVTIKGADAVVLAETSLNAWMMATGVLRARCADEVNDPGWAIVPPAVKALLTPRYAEAIRRVMPDVDEPRSLELAELFIDGLSAGAPEDLL